LIIISCLVAILYRSVFEFYATIVVNIDERKTFALLFAADE